MALWVLQVKNQTVRTIYWLRQYARDILVIQDIQDYRINTHNNLMFTYSIPLYVTNHLDSRLLSQV